MKINKLLQLSPLYDNLHAMAFGLRTGLAELLIAASPSESPRRAQAAAAGSQFFHNGSHVGAHERGTGPSTAGSARSEDPANSPR